MNMRQALGLALLCWFDVSLALAQAVASEPAPENAAHGSTSDSLYQTLVRDAVAEFERGGWAIARELFQRAHTLRPSARTLRGMGMSDFNMRAYARAISELELALDAIEQPLDDVMRAQVEELLARADLYVGRYTLVVSPPGATVLADGQPLLRTHSGEALLDLGSHTIELRESGYHPLAVTVDVREPERRLLTLRALPLVRAEPQTSPPPVAPRQGVRFPWTWTLGAASGASLAGAGMTALFADKRFAELERDCDAQAGCFGEVAGSENVTRLDRASIALLTTGGLLLASTIVAGMFERRRDRALRQAEIEASP